MLYISKWKVVAIIVTTLIVCLFAVPNFFPESTLAKWPKWAQRHIVLGLDLQGGSHILLEVDVNDVRRQKIDSLRDDVRKAMREARITLTGSPAIRGNTVEVRVREADVQQALTKLRELSQPLGGFLGSTGGRSLDVVNAGGGLIQLTVTEPAILERTRQVVDQSIEIIDRRVNALGLVEPSIQRQGADRILVQVPGLGDPAATHQRHRHNRQTDISARRHVDDAPAGAADPSAAGVGNPLRLESRRRPALPAGKACHRIGRRAGRCPAGL